MECLPGDPLQLAPLKWLLKVGLSFPFNLSSIHPKLVSLVDMPVALSGEIDESNIKLFGKWSYDGVKCNDISLVVCIITFVGRNLDINVPCILIGLC